MAEFLKSCNEWQEGKSGKDLFGQIVAKSLCKLSNWEIKEEVKLEIQTLLFQGKNLRQFSFKLVPYICINVQNSFIVFRICR